MRLRSGSPHWIVDQRTIDSTSIVFDLTCGPNLAELTEVGLRQGFQVTGVGSTKVMEGHGPTATAAQDRQALHQLEVRPSNPAASLSLTDSSLRIIHQDTGAVDVQLRPGLYKIRIEIARDVGSVSEPIILLDDDVDDSAESLPVPTPAPLAHSASGKTRRRKLLLIVASRLHPLSVLEVRDRHGSYIQRFDTARSIPSPRPPDQSVCGSGRFPAGPITCVTDFPNKQPFSWGLREPRTRANSRILSLRPRALRRPKAAIPCGSAMRRSWKGCSWKPTATDRHDHRRLCAAARRRGARARLAQDRAIR